MEYYKLAMLRPNLRNIPPYKLPKGWSIRTFEANDRGYWADIEASVDEFASVEKARVHFDREFGDHLDEMKERCLFLCDPEGCPVGTTTAWYGHFHGKPMGRIHWVAIHPKWQGRGLSKPLLSRALTVLAHWHDSAYLTTQTTSWRAVFLYMEFGFIKVPRMKDDADYEKGWQLIDSLKKNR